MENIQKFLDKFVKENNLSCRYLIREDSMRVKSFGGLMDYMIFFYRVEDSKPSLIKSFTVKGKSDTVKDEAYYKLMEYICTSGELNYGME